jgi:hypothetical protein
MSRYKTFTIKCWTCDFDGGILAALTRWRKQLSARCLKLFATRGSASQTPGEKSAVRWCEPNGWLSHTRVPVLKRLD